MFQPLCRATHNLPGLRKHRMHYEQFICYPENIAKFKSNIRLFSFCTNFNSIFPWIHEFVPSSPPPQGTIYKTKLTLPPKTLYLSQALEVRPIILQKSKIRMSKQLCVAFEPLGFMTFGVILCWNFKRLCIYDNGLTKGIRLFLLLSQKIVW